jgi:GTP cyclohydrolase I
MRSVDYTEQEKIDIIRDSMRDIMITLGLDLEDDSLCDTPNRVAKMYVKELYWGLQTENFPKCTTIENKMGYDEMVVEKCAITSGCEHHLVYFGSAHNSSDLGCWIAYIPKHKVVGLSKLSRVAEYFAHRPQVQERLTEQICAALQFILETDDVAVVIKAQHFCVVTRGVEDTSAHTITSKLGGAFKTNLALRQEFMTCINN